jgi:hypothetical protein
MLFINAPGSNWTTNGPLFPIGSLVVCWIVGGFVGELIGKKLQYRWPPVFIGL